jgi:hypothetical protein
MDNKLSSYFCRICGHKQSEAPWGTDGRTPTFDYCPCCGVEFGYQDCNLKAVRAFRENWLKKGAVWSEPEKLIKPWNLAEQLKNIPYEFK